jgi:hypothetical protein
MTCVAETDCMVHGIQNAVEEGHKFLGTGASIQVSYAARLETEPLSAAYRDALTSWGQSQVAAALKRWFEAANREKTRHMANRVAQTELARAHQTTPGVELMVDATIAVVQVVLSPSHPRTDVGDLHTLTNLFGLGPGAVPERQGASADVPPALLVQAGLSARSVGGRRTDEEGRRGGVPARVARGRGGGRDGVADEVAVRAERERRAGGGESRGAQRLPDSSAGE